MSARTAQVLGYILVVLVITLTISKLISNYFTRIRQPRRNQPELAASTTPGRRRIKLPRLPLPAPHLPRPHLPRLHMPRRRRQRPTRAERAAIRRQNWQHHLENQVNTAVVNPATTPDLAPESEYQAPA
jgi:hypothetical protein